MPGPPARPPAELLGLLVAYLRGREVAPVARLRTRRQGVLADGAEIVEDSVSVLVGQRVTRRFRELEVELVGGDERVAPPTREAAPPRGRRILRRAPAQALPGARARPAACRSDTASRRPGPRRARRRARGAGPAAAPARPGDTPRLGPRGPPPAPRRHAAAAGVPPRRPAPDRALLVGPAPRRAGLAREGARARP